MEYPRADKAVIVEAENGRRHEVAAGGTAKALQYEMEDMERAVLNGDTLQMRLKDTRDVMDIMTDLRSIQEKSGDRIRKQAPLCDQTGTRIILSKFKEYLVKKKNRD